jgi:hypothetical protein
MACVRLSLRPTKHLKERNASMYTDSRTELWQPKQLISKTELWQQKQINSATELWQPKESNLTTELWQPKQ